VGPVREHHRWHGGVSLAIGQNFDAGGRMFSDRGMVGVVRGLGVRAAG
jgi:hypothetical protein